MFSGPIVHGVQGVLPLISEEESRVVLRRKLFETAENFERSLRDELLNIESEVFDEFRMILEALDTTHDHLTQEIGEKLRLEREEVLRKTNKVAIYSSFVAENLYKELKRLLTELGVWTVDVNDASAVFNHQQELLAETQDSLSTANESYRSKRQMIDWDLDSDDRQNLALYEPFKEEELEDVLESFEYMNSQMGPRGSPDEAHAVWVTSDAVEIPGPRGESRKFPKDCLDLLESGLTQDGVYTIYPTGLGVPAWCDMSSAGGGWTVVAGRRARQPRVNFSRPLLHYQFGFGDPETQHWLASTAEDALSPHNGAVFTCPGSGFSANPCAEEMGAGWWFLEAPLCYLTLPTGEVSSEGRPRGMRGSLAWLGEDQIPDTLLLMVRRNG
ncbi:Angiopoietin-2 [Portunus trituberculatus]|uniref:Angiopoietin-2 n=1 Tax=Portunus trituberculatus TaxID=210409 RepID=A0A5B7GAG7_PORTR|nr:Angiopoietin-2 [Portunus trituberculatus]